AGQPGGVRPGRRVDGGRTALREHGAELGIHRPEGAGARGAHPPSGDLHGAGRRSHAVTTTRRPALMVLEDGATFRGRAFGAEGETFGEAVFNTAMTGYQEVLTDPSYANQIVTMTAPHQGNYGVNPHDPESGRVQVAGFVVRELSRRPSSWRATGSLEEYVGRAGVIGIDGVDTRRLTLRIREGGAIRAGISTVDLDPASLLARVRAI